MPASWLYQINAEGMLVTSDIMERARTGNRAALQAINRQPLTRLYWAGYTRPRRNDAIGMLWADVPPLEHIPFIRGRNSPPAWLKDYMFVEHTGGTKKTVRDAMYIAKGVKQTQRREERWRRRRARTVPTVEEPPVSISVQINKKRHVRGWYMNANPKFDLVVVNRYDRGALLKLLGELDGATNVPRWIANCTTRGGATAAAALHADYMTWCEREDEVPTGVKGFAQGLVVAGVAKLPRSAGGVRYELQLR